MEAKEVSKKYIEFTHKGARILMLCWFFILFSLKLSQELQLQDYKANIDTLIICHTKL